MQRTFFEIDDPSSTLHVSYLKKKKRERESTTVEEQVKSINPKTPLKVCLSDIGGEVGDLQRETQ